MLAVFFGRILIIRIFYRSRLFLVNLGWIIPWLIDILWIHFRMLAILFTIILIVILFLINRLVLHSHRWISLWLCNFLYWYFFLPFILITRPITISLLLVEIDWLFLIHHRWIIKHIRMLTIFFM